jgi:dihydroxy-acid dehydratase
MIKPSAASKHLMNHTGKAVVFETIDDYKERIADPNLDIDEKWYYGDEKCGIKRLPWHARSWQYGIASKTFRKRDHGYGSYF